MGYHQCLFLMLVFGYAVFQDVSGSIVASITKSSDETLRDPGTYIVYFMKSAKKAQLKDFVTQLIRISKKTEHFEVEIVSEYFSIKSLSARLSKQALSWVRVLL